MPTDPLSPAELATLIGVSRGWVIARLVDKTGDLVADLLERDTTTRTGWRHDMIPATRNDLTGYWQIDPADVNVLLEAATLDT